MKTEFMSSAPKNWKDLEPHALAALVTFGIGIDLEKLAQHMRQHGYDGDEPIIIFEGRILDGRHRHLAAQEASVVPTFKRFVGTESEARANVVKKCLRQHLTVSQLGLLAGKLANMTNGRPEKTSSNDDVSENDKAKSLESAAEEVGVSKKTAERGKKVADHGTERLQAAVAEEVISLSDAAAVADEPKRVQDAAVKAVKTGKSRTAKAAVKTLAEEVADAVAEPEEDVPDPTIEEIIKEKNGILESFCRRLMKMVEEELPQDEWLDHMNRREGVLQKIRDACAGVRSSKCHAVCPMCKGDKCAKCQKTGRVTKYAYDQLVS